MLPTSLLLFSLCCVALFYFPFAIHQCYPELAEEWAVDENWTHDLFLTKEVLYHWATTAFLSHRVSGSLVICQDVFLTLWLMTILSGRRGSNPRPTAWKAVALPTELLPHYNWESSIGNFEIETAQFPNPPFQNFKIKRTVGKDGFEPPNS